MIVGVVLRNTRIWQVANRYIAPDHANLNRAEYQRAKLENEKTKLIVHYHQCKYCCKRI